jgi:hypothetical protein
MLYVPSSIPAASLDVAAAPYLGGEFNVYLTAVAAILIGEVNLTAAGAGAYTDNGATAIVAQSPSTGADLQLVALTPLISTATCIIKLAGLNDAGTPVTQDGTATFAPPARAANQSKTFGRGIATDLVAATKFTTITGLALATPITGGAANVRFGLFQLPVQADYSLVGCTTDINFNTKSRQAKGIDCGMETDAFIKRGKTQPGELSIGSKLKGFAEGLARFDGLKTTCMLVGLKDGQETCDRLVFTEWVPNIKPRFPEGDGEATIDAEGKFAEHAFFIAP